MDKIFLIRHGESLANVDNKYYFGPDQAIILTEKGVKQALNIASVVSTLVQTMPDAKIISSKLTRAKITAQIALHKHEDKTIHEDARLNECRFTLDKNNFEPNHSVRARIKSLLDDHPGTLICFCHGDLMWNLDPIRPGVRNCEIRVYHRHKFIEDHLLKDNRSIIL